MSLTLRSQHQHFGGQTQFWSHQSSVCNYPMNFATFIPPQAAAGPVPVLWFLSGLTCTEENFIIKAGAQRLAAKYGVMLVVPDTSPRIDFNGSDKREDLGTGAGYYLDAIVEPWAEHYQMYSYVHDELPSIIAAEFPADMTSQSIFGHSMGGHGALIMHLKNPGLFHSVSAFAPVCAPALRPKSVVPAPFVEMLGPDAEDVWRQYDATALVAEHGSALPIFIDQGAADPLIQYLMPDAFEQACQDAGVELVLRRHADYDHAYFFVSSFMEEHMLYHAHALGCIC